MSAASRRFPKPVFELVMDTDIVVRGELYPKSAPETVGNFIALANSGFYDGMPFHRCIFNYIVQTGRCVEKPLSYCIVGEFEINGCRYNRLPCTAGSLCMARGRHYDSASSEFFIVLTDDLRETRYLDGTYAVFGKVTDGLRYLHAISAVPVSPYTFEPERPQMIRRLRVETFAADYPFQMLPQPTGAIRSHRIWPKSGKSKK